MRAIVDADSLVYAAAFAAQKTRYLLYNPDGFVVGDFPSAKDCALFLEQHPDEGLERDSYTELDTPDTAMQSVESMLSAGLNAVKADDYVVYLTGKKSWRLDYSTILKYKGNRDNMQRPHYYDLCRGYLQQKHNAFNVEFIEADDAVIMDYYANPDDAVMIHIDKDLDQMSGAHFDPRHIDDSIIWIDQWQADFNFYKQLLTGDSTDNILGLSEKGTGKRGIGPATATRMLSECRTARQMFDVCHEAYVDKFGNNFKYEDWRGGITHERSAMEILDENAQLLYLARYDGDRWRVPNE